GRGAALTGQDIANLGRGAFHVVEEATGIQAIEDDFSSAAKWAHGVAAQVQSPYPEDPWWNRQNVANAYNWDRKIAATIPVVVSAGMAGLDATPPDAEAQELMDAWAPDPVRGDTMNNILYHFGEHGEDMGAGSVWRYLGQAKAFRKQLKRVSGRLVEGRTDGVKRYVKQGKYIDLTPEGKIVSFGKVRTRGY
ncbi:MAG TPA: hypothetical protein VFJ58_08230, partial [Armatimonadota bacterium]|nr:hypothetical protein [Armatimonadota bacterium]